MTRPQAAFALLVLLIGLFGVGGAVVTAEPGWIAAAERYDGQRVVDLNEIAIAVMQFKVRHKTLPYDVAKIVEAQSPERPLQVSDPLTRLPYEYSRIGEKTYRLCAVFALESTPMTPRIPVVRAPAPPVRSGARALDASGSTTAAYAIAPREGTPGWRVSGDRWSHPAGEHCFEFDDLSSAPLQAVADRETKT